MKPTKNRPAEIFKAMPKTDKFLIAGLAVMGIALFANGLYLVGSNGMLLLLGAIVFHFVMEIYRNTEMKIVTGDVKKKKRPSISSQLMEDGATANKNDGLIRSIIDKKKSNPQQSLLDGVTALSASPHKDEEQARADHEYLVELSRKKQEAMRTAVEGPPADPKVGKEVMEKQAAYIKELMKPTIIPQRELAEKAGKKDSD